MMLKQYTKVDEIEARKFIADSYFEERQSLAQKTDLNVTFTLDPIGSIRSIPLNLLKKVCPLSWARRFSAVKLLYCKWVPSGNS